MVPARYRLQAVAAVMAIGLCLAWPLRRSGPRLQNAPAAEAASTIGVPRTATQEEIPPPWTSAASAPPAKVFSSVGLASLSSPASPGPPMGAHAAVSPAAAQPAVAAGAEPARAPAVGTLRDGSWAESDAPRPAYSLVDSAPREAVAARERRYVVHEGDSLERLAQRYLGDSRRSLEIFSLNRDRLTNPHLLPLGMEILLPVEGGSPSAPLSP